MKLIITLAVTALLALSTVQALSFLEKEELLNKIALLQQDEMEEGDDDNSMAMIATPSNGTVNSILQELGLNKRVRRASECVPVGPYGGGGGRAFNELPDNCDAIATRVVVNAGKYVDNIQVTYELSNGQTYVGGHHGGSGGSRNEVNLNAGERIISIFGASGRYLDSIGFATDQGRVFGPYGGGGGNRFNVNICVLSGIFGRSGNLIDALGFYCGRIELYTSIRL